MRKRFKITASQTDLSVDLGFTATHLVVVNPTSSPVFVRIGAPDIPDRANNADLIVASAVAQTYPVNSDMFGLHALSASLVATPGLSSGLFDSITVEFLDDQEIVPTFGAYNFLSLSLSALIPSTNFTGTTTSATLDLSPWGGALVYVNPLTTSGQGVVAINVSENGTNFFPYGTFAFWPGVPAVINVPRTMRYLQVILNTTAIVGEPVIAGNYAVRATIAEIQNLAYNPTGNAITKTFNMAASGSQQFQFVTVGLPAVSIAAIAAAGTGPGAAITFLVEASSDLVTWRQVTARDQRMSQGITLYRALGNLDLFIRVTIFEISGGNNETGTMYLSIPQQADLGYILNTIQQSLGDKNAPSNTNQDIYHELDSIRTITSSSNTILNTNQPYLSYLPTMNSHEATMDANIAGYLPYLPTINTHATTIDTNTGTMSTTLSNIYSRVGTGAVIYAGGVSIPSGAWTATGIGINGSYKVAYILVIADAIFNGLPILGGVLGIGQGNTGFQQIWQFAPAISGLVYKPEPSPSVVSWNVMYLPPLTTASIAGAGIGIFSNATQLYLFQNVDTGNHTVYATVVAYPA